MTQQEFEQRYLPLAPRLQRMALALLGNADDAKDALQETYLRLWQQSERISELRSPEAFFLLTMRNYCLNQLRSRRKTIQPEGCLISTPPMPHKHSSNASKACLSSSNI